jgi:5-methyltetrahydropteroyltriglutamate--homocysteine methyltransferase
MKKHLQTTVIGSYPVSIPPEPLMQKYFDRTDISWEPYIKNAVNDMVTAGIQIVSDGQTRDPFIQLFTRKLKGCRIRARTEIIDTIEYTGPITVQDQQYLRTIIPRKTQIKGVLTGPYTLSQSCVDLFYHNEREVAFAFAQALHKEALFLQKEVEYISIDEPFFSNTMPEYASELIKTITQGIHCPTILHVCGDVSAILPRIIELPVSILSHEFKAKPQLLEGLHQYSFSQKLCLGCVRSDSIQIESVDEIKEHITYAVHLFGERIIHLAPDCGQRLLPQSVAFEKLKNLAVAGEQKYG